MKTVFQARHIELLRGMQDNIWSEWGDVAGHANEQQMTNQEPRRLTNVQMTKQEHYQQCTAHHY